MGVTSASESVVVRLTKPHAQLFNLTMRIEGSDWQAGKAYSWAIDTSNVAGYGDWVRIPQTEGEIIGGEDVIEVNVAVELRSMGRAEGVTAYLSSVPFEFTLQASQHFVTPISLIVTGHAVAANSRLLVRSTQVVVLEESDFFTFELRDLDRMLLDHGGDTAGVEVL